MYFASSNLLFFGLYLAALLCYNGSLADDTNQDRFQVIQMDFDTNNFFEKCADIGFKYVIPSLIFAIIVAAIFRNRL